MKTWIISDTHFGHNNILTFRREDGTPLRDFKDINHMNEQLISNWNSLVSENDKVYHLGDIGFKNFTEVKSIFDRLNGRKVLIKGNHDNFKMSQYTQIFYDIRAYHVLDNILLAHIPVHPMSLTRWRGQIHGHLHDKVLPDNRYLNVSVERTNYFPVDFNIIKDNFEPKTTTNTSST